MCTGKYQIPIGIQNCVRIMMILTVGLPGGKWYMASRFITESILIIKGMVVWLVCNHPQPQDVSTQTDVIKNRVGLDGLPSSDSLERRPVMRDPQAIPLMLRSSNLEWVSREMGTAFMMGGASYLPWLSGVLEEHPGKGYWLPFAQRLPILFKAGDRLYSLMH